MGNDNTRKNYCATPSSPEEQMREYFSTLFPILGDSEQINIRPALADTALADKTFLKNTFHGTVDGAVEECLNQRRMRHHVYAGINPRDEDKVIDLKVSGGRPGGKAGVSRAITLFSDFDYRKMGKSLEQALEYLWSLPCPSSMIVDTGGGLQPYWLLETPATNDADKALAERIMSAMCAWWRTDKVKDYSRILRVPGTQNHKPEYGEPRECTIVQADNGRRYSLDELWAMVPEEHRAPQASASPGPNGSQPSGDGHPLDPPDQALGDGDGRNQALTSYAGFLETKGLTPEQIRQMLLERNSNPNWFAEPLPIAEVDAIMTSVLQWRQKRKDRGDMTKPDRNGNYGLSPFVHSPPSMSMDEPMDEEKSTSNDSFEGFRFAGLPEPPPRQWVMKDLIPEDYPSTWFGDGGVMKSILALHLGISIASPDIHQWMGHDIITGPVVYADLELDRKEQLRRAIRLARGLNLPGVPEGLIYLPMWDVEVAYGTPADLLRDAHRICKITQASLMILDSIGLAIEGDSEASRDVLAFARVIRQFSAANIPVLQIDHQGKIIKGENYKDKKEFGSSYKRHMTRSSSQLQRISSEGPEVVVSFTHGKTNLGAQVEPFHVKAQFGGDAITINTATGADIPEPSYSSKELVMSDLVLLGRATSADIKEKGTYSRDLKEGTISNALRALVNDNGVVCKDGKEGKHIAYTPVEGMVTDHLTRPLLNTRPPSSIEYSRGRMDEWTSEDPTGPDPANANGQVHPDDHIEGFDGPDEPGEEG